MRETATHIYFYTNWLSNFHRCTIRYKLYKLHCSEQLYMCFKAGYFRDQESLALLVDCKTPREAKDLGRKVTPFDQEKWDAISLDYMYEACLAKFQQNDDIKAKLLATGNKTLVEASPYDLIWGVGLAENDDKILDEKNWRGKNRLGRVLINVRANI